MMDYLRVARIALSAADEWERELSTLHTDEEQADIWRECYVAKKLEDTLNE